MTPTLTGLRRGDTGICFQWSDGLEVELSPRELRIQCPCALCVSEATGARILDPDTIPIGLGFKDMQPIGNYAYRLLFEDGHDTGIFTLEILRGLCERVGP